jgi:hypothetical protein
LTDLRALLGAVLCCRPLLPRSSLLFIDDNGDMDVRSSLLDAFCTTSRKAEATVHPGRVQC